MTLLVMTLAASFATLVWYVSKRRKELKLSVLCFMYWGASLMWLADAIFEFVELGAEYFNPAPADVLNDFLLGLSAVALGLVAWIVILLVKDPLGVIRQNSADSE